MQPVATGQRAAQGEEMAELTTPGVAGTASKMAAPARNDYQSGKAYRANPGDWIQPVATGPCAVQGEKLTELFNPGLAGTASINGGARRQGLPERRYLQCRRRPS